MALDDTVRKIASTLLTPIIALGLYTAKPQDAYAGDAEAATLDRPVIEQGYHPLPSTDGWRKIGQYMDDRSEKVPGKETLLEGYRKDNQILVIASINSKPYAYWYQNPDDKTDSYGTRIDRNADGNFEVRGLDGVATYDFGLDYSKFLK